MRSEEEMVDSGITSYVFPGWSGESSRAAEIDAAGCSGYEVRSSD
jgi:hypothetical protein